MMKGSRVSGGRGRKSLQDSSSWAITRVNNTVKSGSQKLAEVRQEFPLIIKVCRWRNSSKHLIHSAVYFASLTF